MLESTINDGYRKDIDVAEAWIKPYAQERRRADVRKWSDKIYFTEDMARAPEFFLITCYRKMTYGEDGEPVILGR